MPTMELDEAKARELEEKFDSEIRFRPLAPLAARLVGTLLVVLSLFHYYTAGFGLLPEMIHRGIHLSFVLGLIFLVFPITKRGYERPVPAGPASSARASPCRTGSSPSPRWWRCCTCR